MTAAVLALLALSGRAVAGGGPAPYTTPDPASAIVAQALKAELSRASTLKLADAPSPYLVGFDVLDGHVSQALAEDGGLVSFSDQPYRNLRVEVRVGDYSVDSSNFGGFGEPDGVVNRNLPTEDNELALRREIWLATDAAYKHSVEALSHKLAARRGQKETPPPDYQKIAPVVVAAGSHPGTAYSSAEVAELSTSLSAAASIPGVEAAQAEIRDWHGWRYVTSTEGSAFWTPTGNVVVRVSASARRPDGATLSDARWWVGKDANRMPAPSAMEAACREMARSLVASAAAPDPEPWLGPVIFEGPAAAELFSQLLAPEFVGTRPEESDQGGMISKPDSPTARLGRRLLPLGWSVWDDPSTQTGAAGEYGIDHEGVRPRRVDLVVDGVLKDVLMSRIPGKERTASTGHGRSLGGDRRGAIPGYVHVRAAKLVAEKKLRKTALSLAKAVGRSQVLVISRLTPPSMIDSLDVTFTGQGPPAGLTAPYEACLLAADGVCTPTRSYRFVGVDRRELRDVIAAAAGPGPVDMLDGPPGPQRYLIGSTGGVPTTWDVPSVLLAEVELDPATGGEPRVLDTVSSAAPPPAPAVVVPAP